MLLDDAGVGYSFATYPLLHMGLSLVITIIDYWCNSVVCPDETRLSLKSCKEQFAPLRSERKGKKATEAAFLLFGNGYGLRLLDHPRHGPGFGLGERSASFDFNQIAFFGDAGFVVGVIFL